MGKSPKIKMMAFDFVMDSFVAVEAPQGTDPDTLMEEAKIKFMERLRDNEAVIMFDGEFDPNE